MFNREKSLEELEEEDERKTVEVSIAEKNRILKLAKQRGAPLSQFRTGGGGFDFRRIVQWLKTH